LFHGITFSKQGAPEGVTCSYARLLAYLLPYKRRFLGALVTALLAGFSATAAMAVVGVVAKMVLGGEIAFETKVPLLGKMDLTPYLKQWLPADGEWRTMGRVMAVCASIPLVMGIRGVLDSLANYQRMWVEQRMTLDLRRKVFGQIMGRSLEFSNKQRSSDLMQTAFGMTLICSNTATTIAQDLVRRPRRFCLR